MSYAWDGDVAIFLSFDPTVDAIRVVPSSTSGGAPTLGRSPVTTNRKDYSGGSVGTSTWVQLVAALSAQVNEVEIFDSSGQTMELGVGGVGSEVRQIIIFPGGNGRVPLKIASGSRVSIRAISGTASGGENDINFYG